MYIFICIYIYMYICIYVYIYIRIHINPGLLYIMHTLRFHMILNADEVGCRSRLKASNLSLRQTYLQTDRLTKWFIVLHFATQNNSARANLISLKKPFIRNILLLLVKFT